MTFTMHTEMDEDRARSLAGVIKNDGLWKSDKQARYARRHMPIRVNAYYDDSSDELEPEYDRGERYLTTLAEGQIFTKVEGSITFAPTNPSDEWMGGEGGHRPWTKIYVLDGIGVVRAAKVKFRKSANGYGWDVRELETVFERTTSGPDHWALQDIQVAEAKARREAEDAAAEDAPTGRVEVKGVVLSTKYQSSDFGDTLKMLVKDERGFRVWTTVPSRMHGIDKGSQVHIKVTLTPSDDDPKFAFGKRPADVTKCAIESGGCAAHAIDMDAKFYGGA